MKKSLPYYILGASALFLSSLATLPAFAGTRGDSEEFSSETDTHYPAIIKISSEDAAERLIEDGVQILRRRDNLLLCYIPYKPDQTRSSRSRARINKESRKRNSGILRIEPGRKVARTMDVAPKWFNAESLHAGSDFALPYTGKGVVTGICDLGIDPLHVSFLDEEGNPRIKRIVQYKEGSGERIVLNSKEEFLQWETDTRENWHASHVANIMAGSFSPFSGMAPDSEMVITTSQLSDVGLLCGAEDILEYAKETGKRAVINMSMANYLGPHDGTSLFSQYLDKIGEEAIVVLSAGNGGRRNMSLPFNFTEEKISAGLPLYSTDWVQFNPYGAVDIWSADSRPVKVRFGIQNGQEQKILKMYPWQELYDRNSWTISSNPEDASEGNDTVIYDPEFAEIFQGWFSISAEINPENNRYNATLSYDAHTEHVASQGKWAKYIPVVEVSGEPGVHADIYADNQYTVFRALPGGYMPSPDLSFSDLATGSNVISVGMYVNRESYPVLGKDSASSDLTVGTIAPMSSYSTLRDGRVMPTTVAPGYDVVSAISRHYLKEHPDGALLNAETVKDGETYRWALNSGTSMSSPYTAGVLACWLEALPDLTTSEAIEAITASNRHDYPDPENPRHGRGWLDPVEGLRTAMNNNLSGIGGSIFDQSGSGSYSSDSRKLTFSASSLSLWNPQGKETSVILSDLSGKEVGRFSSSEAISSFSLASLSQGVYIARIQSSDIYLKIMKR